MRDDFPESVKDLLAKRVGYRCSNPDCGKLTAGPKTSEAGSINVGVAAHITAASRTGPRYDPTIPSDKRRAPSNGIWLCQTCAKLIDSDTNRYTVSFLRGWKTAAEHAALAELEGRTHLAHGEIKTMARMEDLMPDLLAEMRRDVAAHPLKREFVLLGRGWHYWAKGNELVYYFEDHDELRTKMDVLVNNGLIRNITYNNVDRYVFEEHFVEYLGAYADPADAV